MSVNPSIYRKSACKVDYLHFLKFIVVAFLRCRYFFSLCLLRVSNSHYIFIFLCIEANSVITSIVKILINIIELAKRASVKLIVVKDT